MKNNREAGWRKIIIYLAVTFFSLGSIFGVLVFLAHQTLATSLPNILVGSCQCNTSNICTSYDASGSTIGTGGSAGSIVLPTGFGAPQAVMVNQANVSTTGSFTTPYIRINGMGSNKSKGLIGSGQKQMIDLIGLGGSRRRTNHCTLGIRNFQAAEKQQLSLVRIIIDETYELL